MDDDETEPGISLETCMLMEVTELNPSTPADQSDSSASTSTTRPSSTLPISARRLTSKSYSIRTRSSSKHKSHDHHSSTTASDQSSGGGHAKHLHHHHHHHEVPYGRESRSGGTAGGGGDDDDQKTVTVVYARNDRFVSSQDICASCGSFGSSDVEKKLISCVQCGNCYHIFCAHPSSQYALPVSDEMQPKVNPVVSKWGWRCLECTVCEGCGEPHDEARLILCEDCDISYHIYCLKPPLKEVPSEAWRCDRCAHCQFCGSRQVSCKINSKTKASENYTACKKCISLFVCAYCKKNYTEGTPLMHCSTCRQWMHQECFDESYKPLSYDELNKLVDAATKDEKGLVCSHCIKGNKRARSISGDPVGFSANDVVDNDLRSAKAAKSDDQQVPGVAAAGELSKTADDEQCNAESEQQEQSEAMWPLILSREPRDLLSHDGMFLTERGYVMFKERERYLYNVTHGIQLNGVGAGRGGKAGRGRRKRGGGPPSLHGPPGSIGEHRGSDASSVSSGGAAGKRGRGAGGRGSRGPRKNCKVGVGGFSARLWSNKTRGRLARISASDVVTAGGSPMRGGSNNMGQHLSLHHASSLSSVAAVSGGVGGLNDDFLQAFASKDSQGDVFIDINNADNNHQPRGGRQSSRANIQGLRHQYPAFIVDAFFTTPKQHASTLASTADNEFNDTDSSSQNVELLRAGIVDDNVFLDDDDVVAANGVAPKPSGKPRLTLALPPPVDAGAVQGGRETPPAEQQRQVVADGDDLQGRSRASKSSFHPPTLTQYISNQKADLLRKFWKSTSSRAESQLTAMRANAAASSAAAATEMDTDDNNADNNYASTGVTDQTTPIPELQLRPESSVAGKIDLHGELLDPNTGGGAAGTSGSGGRGGGGVVDHADVDANLHGMVLPDDLDDLALDEDDLMALFDSNAHEFSDALEGVDMESLNVDAALAAAPTLSSAASGTLQPQQCSDQSSAAGGGAEQQHLTQIKREQQRNSSVDDEKPPQIIIKREGSVESHQPRADGSGQTATAGGGGVDDNTLENLMNQFDIQSALGSGSNSELSNLVELSGSDADDLFKNLCALDEPPTGSMPAHSAPFGGGRPAPSTSLIPPPQLGMHPPNVGGGVQPPVLASTSPSAALLEASSSSSLLISTSAASSQQLVYQQQSVQYAMHSQQQLHMPSPAEQHRQQQQYQVIQQRTSVPNNSGLPQGPSHLSQQQQQQQQYGHVLQQQQQQQKLQQLQGNMMQQQQLRMHTQPQQQQQLQFSDEYGGYSSFHSQQQHSAGGNVVRTVIAHTSGHAGHMPDSSSVMVMPPMYAPQAHQPNFAMPPQLTMQAPSMHSSVPLEEQQQQLLHQQHTNSDVRMGPNTATAAATVQQQPDLTSPGPPASSADQQSSSQQAPPDAGYQQKQLYKWGIDEKRGLKAVCGPVLWANECHPEWKAEHPQWSDRNKYIMKCWKELTDKAVKEQYVKKARENRSEQKAAEKLAEKQKNKAAKKQKPSAASTSSAQAEEGDEDGDDEKADKNENDGERHSDDENGSASKTAPTLTNATPAPPPQTFVVSTERATPASAGPVLTPQQPQHHMAGPSMQHLQQQHVIGGTPLPQQSPSHHPSMSPFSQKSTTPQSFTYPPPSVSSTNSSGIDVQQQQQQQLMRYPSGMGGQDGLPPGMVRTPSAYHMSTRFGPPQQQQQMGGVAGEHEMSYDLQPQQQQQSMAPRQMLTPEGYQSGPTTPYGPVPMSPHSSSQQFPQQMQQRYARGHVPSGPPMSVPYGASPQQIQQQQLRMAQQQQQQQQLRYGNMQQQSPQPNSPFLAGPQQQQRQPSMMAVPGGMAAVRQPGSEAGMMTSQQHMGSPEYSMVRGVPYAQNRPSYAVPQQQQQQQQQMQMQAQHQHSQYAQQQQYITGRTRDGVIVQHALRPGDMQQQQRWAGPLQQQQQQQQYMPPIQDPSLVYYRTPQQPHQQQWQYNVGDPAQGMRPRVPHQLGIPPQHQQQQARLQQQSPMPQGVYGPVRVAYGPPPPSPGGQQPGMPPQMQMQYAAASNSSRPPGSFMPQQQQQQQVPQMPPGARYVSHQQAQMMQQQRIGIAVPAQYYPTVSAAMQHQSSQSPQPQMSALVQQQQFQQQQQRAIFNPPPLASPSSGQPPMMPAASGSGSQQAASARDATPSSQSSQPLSAPSAPPPAAVATASATASPPPPPPEVAQKLEEMAKMAAELQTWGAEIDAVRKEKKALSSSQRKRHQKSEQLSEEEQQRLDVLKKKVQSLQKRIEGKRKKLKVTNQSLPPEYQKQLPPTASTSKAAAAKEAATASAVGGESSSQEQSSDAAGPTSPASSSAAVASTAAGSVMSHTHLSTSPTTPNIPPDMMAYQQQQQSQSRLRAVGAMPQQIPAMMRMPGTPGSGGGLMLVGARGASGTSPSPFALQPVSSIPSSSPRPPPGSFRVPMQPPQGMGISPQIMSNQMPPSGMNAFSPHNSNAMQQQQRAPPPPYHHQQQQMNRPSSQQYVSIPGGPYGAGVGLMPRVIDHQQQHHLAAQQQHSGGVMSTVMRQAGFAPDQQLAFAPICSTIASCMPLGGGTGGLIVTSMQGGGNMITTSSLPVHAMPGTSMTTGGGGGGGREKNPMLKQLLEQSAAASQAAAAAAAASGAEAKSSTPAAIKNETGSAAGDTARPSLKRKTSASLSISSATATSDADTSMSAEAHRPQSGAAAAASTMESLVRQLSRNALPLQEPSMLNSLNQRTQLIGCKAEALFDLKSSTLYNTVLKKTDDVSDLREKPEDDVFDTSKSPSNGRIGKSQPELLDAVRQFEKRCTSMVLPGYENVVASVAKAKPRKPHAKGYNSLLMPDSKDVPSVVLGDDVSLSAGYVSSIGTNSTQAQMQIDQLVQQRRTEKLFGSCSAAANDIENVRQSTASDEPLCHRQLPFVAIMCEKSLNNAPSSAAIAWGNDTGAATKAATSAAGANRRHRGSIDKRSASVTTASVKNEPESRTFCTQQTLGAEDAANFAAEAAANDSVTEKSFALIQPKNEGVAVVADFAANSVMASVRAAGDMAFSEAAVAAAASDDTMTGSPNVDKNSGGPVPPKSAILTKNNFSPFLEESDARMTVPETMLHSPVAYSVPLNDVPSEPTPINKFYGIADLRFDPQALDAYGEMREPSASGPFDRRRKQSIGHKASESGATNNGKPDVEVKTEPFMGNFPAQHQQQSVVDPTRTRIRLVITRESSTRLDFVLENLAAVLDADKLWFKPLKINKRFDMQAFLAPFAVNYAVLANNPPVGQNLLGDGLLSENNNNNRRPDYSVCAECGSVCPNPVVLAKWPSSSPARQVPEMLTSVSPPPSQQPSTGGGAADMPNSFENKSLNNDLSRSSSVESVVQQNQPPSTQQQQQQLQDNVFCSSSCFVRFNSIAHGKGVNIDLNGPIRDDDDDVPAVSGDMMSTTDEEPTAGADNNTQNTVSADSNIVDRPTSLLAKEEDKQSDLFAVAERTNSELLYDVLLKARRQPPFSARKHAQILIKFTTRDLRALKRKLQAYRAEMFEHDPHATLLYDVGLRANRNVDPTTEHAAAADDVVIDHRTCVLCGGVGDADPQQAGRLLYYEPNAWVHSNCALWSNDVYETVAGSLMSVTKAVTTSMKRICVSCSRSNASLQCLYPKCTRTYHFPCALREKCSFFEDKSFMCPPHWLVLSQFKMMIGQIRASTGVTEDIITTTEIIGHLAAGGAAGGVGGSGSVGSGAANSTAMSAAVVAVQAAVAAFTAASLATAGANSAVDSGIRPSLQQTPPIDASAAVQQIEALMREYQYEEQQFLQLMSHVNQLEHFACFRRLHVLHKESAHIERILLPEHDGTCTFRTGSLLVHKIGTLMPDQVANFHTTECIYPIGYLASRIYWSTRYFNRRCRYICHIRVFVNEHDNGFVEEVPDFVVEIVEPPFPNSFIVGDSTRAVCGKIFENILAARNSSSSSSATSDTPFAKFFSNIASGDEFFGLRDAHVVRLIESLPNVLEHAVHYKPRTPASKRGQIDVPVAQSRFNAMRYCAYVAPAMRHVMRNGTLQLTASSAGTTTAAAAASLDSGKLRASWARAQAPVRSLSLVEAPERTGDHHRGGAGGHHHRAVGIDRFASASSADLFSASSSQTAGISSAGSSSGGMTGGGSGEIDVPAYFTKQSSQAKSSQYRKLKTDWQKNIYLGRSKISGLGLFAARDIEKNTMVIEYIGQIIRHEVANRRERNYTKQQRQDLYMFRLDDNWVIDATSLGGAARYVNHSCSPNCATEVVQVAPDVKKIVISSTRKILKDEELTYDYKFDVEEGDDKKIPCMCGSAACRGWMN